MLVNMGPDISQNEITSYLARPGPPRNAIKDLVITFVNKNGTFKIVGFWGFLYPPLYTSIYSQRCVDPFRGNLDHREITRQTN